MEFAITDQSGFCARALSRASSGMVARAAARRERFFFSVAGFAQHRARHHTDIKALITGGRRMHFRDVS